MSGWGCPHELDGKCQKVLNKPCDIGMKGCVQSSRFLRVVSKYLPEDEAYRNIYGDQTVIFMPNLLIADNDLKLLTVYKNMKNDNKVAEAKNDGQHYLAESLKSVKTEWAYQIQKGFEEALPKK